MINLMRPHLICILAWHVRSHKKVEWRSSSLDERDLRLHADLVGPFNVLGRILFRYIRQIIGGLLAPDKQNSEPDRLGVP